MVDYEIIIPRLDWLIGGSRIGGSYNRYFASCGTDSATGCLCNKIFNYSVWIEKVEEHEIIKAAVYYGMNSFDNTPEDEIEQASFEMDEDSREEIKDWIENLADKFFE